MAHHLTIAKASFAAGLLRPDVTKLSRDDLVKFHELLETTLSNCSPRNVQNCKNWLLENILPSTTRTSALGKYLTTLSKYIVDGEQEVNKSHVEPAASLSRKRTHILYIINDLLHYAKYHAANDTDLSTLTISLRPFLSDLFQSAVSENHSRIQRRLRDLLEIWTIEKYLPEAVLRDLEDVLSGSNVKLQSLAQSAQAAEHTPRRTGELPFVMPASHGDPAAPYYDLPAGNMMPHIMPNSSTPIRPDRVRALQFAAGPPDEGLVSAVKDFLKDVDNINNAAAKYDDEGIVADIDELGQVSYRDELGELKGDTYYGWSRAFCEKMKRRYEDGSDQSRWRRSRSSSRSLSRSPVKRRRYSDSSSSRSRSYSRPRSKSQDSRGLTSLDRQSRNGISGLARSRSRSPPRFAPTYNANMTQPPPTFTPPISHSLAPPPPPSSLTSRPPFTSLHANQSPPVFYLPPLDPSGVPIPPPKPPNWNGPWPPPPPSMTMSSPHGLTFPPPPPNLRQSNFLPPRGRGSHNHQPHGRR